MTFYITADQTEFGAVLHFTDDITVCTFILQKKYVNCKK